MNEQNPQILEMLKALEENGYDLSSLSKKETKRKIRVAFYGDAPTVGTGFGTVSRNILMELWKTGDYEIQCFGVNYMGNPHNFPFHIYPMILNNERDPYGRQKFKEMLPHIEFDILLMNQDSFIIKDFLPEATKTMREQGKRFKSVVYFPVDGRPRRNWIEAMAVADVPITYTKWGTQQCCNEFPDIKGRLSYIYHGVNPKEFFPINEEGRQQLRKHYFKDHADKFIVMNLNRNQPRKDIPRTMMAFSLFKKDIPNSVLYLHMAHVDFGWDIIEVADTLGLEVGKDVLLPANFNVNSGFPVSVVNELYNSADVIVSTTLGEGVGLSVIESMACGIPFIGPNNTALTELLADGRGFLCRSGDTWNQRIIMSNDNSVVRSLCNVDDMVKYLKRLYENKDLRMRTAHKAHTWMMENIQWDKNIVPQFDVKIKQAYEELMKEFLNQTPVVPVEPTKALDWKRGEVV